MTDWTGADYQAILVGVAAIVGPIVGAVTTVLTFQRMNSLEKNTNSKMDSLLMQKGALGEQKGRQDVRDEADEARAAAPTTIVADQIVTDKIVTKA